MIDLYSARKRIFSAQGRQDRLELITVLLMSCALLASAGVLWSVGEWVFLGRLVSTIWVPVVCLPLSIGAFWSGSKTRLALKEAKLDLDAALISAELEPQARWSIRHPWRV
jgi:hypothetical protein